MNLGFVWFGYFLVRMGEDKGSCHKDENDESDYVDKSDGNDNGDGSSDDHDDASDDERTEYDRDEIPDHNLTNEEEDKVTKELYDDVNVNLGNKDIEMTNADQGASIQQYASQQPGFKQEEKDAHMTLTHVLDTQKTEDDNEIASFMNTTTHHATAIPKITSSFTTTIPPPPSFFNLLSQQVTPTLTPMASETKTSLLALLDFASVFKFNERVTNLEKALTIIKEEVNAQLPQILPQAILDVVTLVIKKNVIESLEAAVLIRGVETIKTKIKTHLLDQTEGRKEGNQIRMLSLPEIQEEPSHTIEDSLMQQDQEFITGHNDEQPADKKEPSHTIEDSLMQQDQEFITGHNDEQPADKKVTKADWFKKPERPLTLDPDWLKRQQVDFRPPQTWISQVARAKEPPTSFDELNDTSFNFFAFVMNRF
uniref:Uncharacterized protein n=1 Tax=Tanacetum cinerariifolium TaxID=118510 RepID=A0A6L2JCB3_TANCI|nr:hypothetical protein [Tanacetum cinerariifolium]